MLRRSLTWIGAKRRGVTAVVSALAAVALAASMAGRGCNLDGDGPEGVIRKLVNARSLADRSVVYDLLGPKTKAALEIEARRATDLVGGWKRFDPVELIGVGEASAVSTPAYAIQEKDDFLIVEMPRPDGSESQLILLEIDGQWKIEIPDYVNQ